MTPLVAENGHLSGTPLTDVPVVDPFVAAAAGRCPFRVEDLLSLAALIDGWSVKEIMA